LTTSGANRRLKILHIDPEQNWGGGEAQVFGLINCLAANGHETELLAHPNGQLFSRCQKLKIVCRPIAIRNDLDLRCIPALRRLIRTGDYDIVHLHTKRAHALTVWLPRFHSRPKYLVTRRMDYPESNNWYTHCLYNRRVDGVVAISQSIAELLLAAGVTRERIRVIASGIEPRRFMAAQPTAVKSAGELVLGSVGVLEERKGHRYLLEAAGKLKRQGLAITIRIAGDGSLRHSLQRDAVRLGLQDDVQFCGFVADTAAFLADVDVFVMPSLFEGLGVAGLEAMAAGKAVIASRVGGLTESVVDNVTGILVSPRDPEALAGAITTLAAQPELAAEMGQRGRTRVLEHFTLDQMALKNEACYYELLGAVN
jgi:L-malate glycosyltransferase